MTHIYGAGETSPGHPPQRRTSKRTSRGQNEHNDRPSFPGVLEAPLHHLIAETTLIPPLEIEMLRQVVRKRRHNDVARETSKRRIMGVLWPQRYSGEQVEMEVIRFKRIVAKVCC